MLAYNINCLFKKIRNNSLPLTTNTKTFIIKLKVNAVAF